MSGATVGERRVSAQNSESVDRMRQMLVQQPRGHTDMTEFSTAVMNAACK